MLGDELGPSLRHSSDLHEVLTPQQVHQGDGSASENEPLYLKSIRQRKRNFPSSDTSPTDRVLPIPSLPLDRAKRHMRRLRRSSGIAHPYLHSDSRPADHRALQRKAVRERRSMVDILGTMPQSSNFDDSELDDNPCLFFDIQEPRSVGLAADALSPVAQEELESLMCFPQAVPSYSAVSLATDRLANERGFARIQQIPTEAMLAEREARHAIRIRDSSAKSLMNEVRYEACNFLVNENGMRFRWLEDIPAEVRHQIYKHMFQEKIFKVHDPTAHAEALGLVHKDWMKPMDWQKRIDTIWQERLIFQCSRKVNEEARAVALQTGMYDVRPCRKSNTCDPLKYLTSRCPQQLSQMTRILCHAGGAPQILHLARSTLSQSTNVCRLMEINISYNLRSVSEILGLSDPNTRDSFRALYKKHLSKQLKEFYRLFSGSSTVVRLCSQRLSGTGHDGKGSCEMLSLGENKAVIDLRKHSPTPREPDEHVKMEDALKGLLNSDTLEVIFRTDGSCDSLPFVMDLGFDTSLASTI